MSPGDVLLALVLADVRMWANGRRLFYRAPVGALTPALRSQAAACRPALVALVRAGAVLPADRQAWGPLAVESHAERAGILRFDGGLSPSAAEAEAERLVRVAHTRAFIGRAALLTSQTPSSSLADEPGAVASCPGRPPRAG